MFLHHCYRLVQQAAQFPPLGLPPLPPVQPPQCRWALDAAVLDGHLPMQST